MIGCRWYALLLTRSVNTYTTCIMRSLRQSSCCYWSAVDFSGRATVVEVGWRRCCLEDCWKCCSSPRLFRRDVLFSEARWSQRVSWSSWFPLKSLQTCFYRWLHCELQNVPCEYANCTLELNVLIGPSHLSDRRRSYFTTDSQSVCLGQSESESESLFD
jgi:hypothetical protein